MFGLSAASLVLYGGIFAAGAGGVYYVMDLRAENVSLRADLTACEDAAEDRAEADAAVLKAAALRLAAAKAEAAAEREATNNLLELAVDTAPAQTCSAAVLAVQRALK